MSRLELAELVSRDLADTLRRYEARALDVQIGEHKRNIAAKQIPTLEATLLRRIQWMKELSDG